MPMLQGVLIGYTNAGKSTIMNKITKADTLEENKLFATLDPTTKKIKTIGNSQVLITDTVAFIAENRTSS